MCFYNNQQSEARVAESDIECYKYLNNNEDGELNSPIYSNVWKEKKIYEEMHFNLQEVGQLEYGFHSCKSLQECNRFRRDICDSNSLIYKFIIPKGALYYENSTQYLSNKIYLASEESVEE